MPKETYERRYYRIFNVSDTSSAVEIEAWVNSLLGQDHFGYVSFQAVGDVGLLVEVTRWEEKPQ